MNTTDKSSSVMLTGDRPTGPLHLGHFAGSLKMRAELQSYEGRRFIMIADTQAYTDNLDNTQKVKDAIPELMADYLACGIDPERTTIFLQSAVPELHELTALYMNMTTISRLERNPTIRDEINLRNFERNIPAGFMCYPVSQAADITGFKATVVPVGNDQLPMIELAAEIARKINRMAGKVILPEPKPLLSSVQRLLGIDGKAKASKSLNNAIFLSDDAKTVVEKVMQMYTDDMHLKVSDPGRVEGNVVFSYLDAFCPDKEEVAALKAHYQSGGLGDVTIKRKLISTLNTMMEPIREKRAEAFSRKDMLFDILKTGSAEAREVVRQTLNDIKQGLNMFQL